MLENRRILVVAPHADDETFGCAGTIARAKSEGRSVHVIYVSTGDVRHRNANDPVVQATTREEEINRAAQIMGIDGYTILYRDSNLHMRIDTVPRRDLTTLIERDAEFSIDSIEPDILLLPAPSYNQDHEAVFYAGFAACRPHLHREKAFVSLVLTYDQPQLAWSHTASFHPNFYVDISAFLSVKLKAHTCHASQLHPDPHHASIENLKRFAQVRGSEISVEAAEAFHCHRCVV